MKKALRKALSLFGLVLASDYKSFRSSCVEFCDKMAWDKEMVLFSGNELKLKSVDCGIIVVGDLVSIHGCSISGKVSVAPWVSWTSISNCYFYQKEGEE